MFDLIHDDCLEHAHEGQTLAPRLAFIGFQHRHQRFHKGTELRQWLRLAIIIGMGSLIIAKDTPHSVAGDALSTPE